MNWFLLNSGSCAPAFNMAMDDALLEAMPRLQQPVLRFYGWTKPAATFGYFQKFAEVERVTLLRPLIRRPTGGGIVPHDADWTYCLTFPADHEWHGLRAEESYRRAHEWIRAAFARLNVEAELVSCCRKIPTPPRSSRREEAHSSIADRGVSTLRSATEDGRCAESSQSLLTSAATSGLPGQCFVGHEKSDLLWQGRKIAGAAQRRTLGGLLIQGSVQPPPVGLRRADWEKAMCDVAGATWRDFSPDAALRARVEMLVAQKYSHTTFLEKR